MARSGDSGLLAVAPAKLYNRPSLEHPLRIVVNGESKDLAGPMSVAGLLEAMGLHPRRVAVERNKQLVPRARFADTALAEGDCLEIVTLVGGG